MIKTDLTTECVLTICQLELVVPKLVTNLKNVGHFFKKFTLSPDPGMVSAFGVQPRQLRLF